MPKPRTLLWPTLRAVFELGGSASISEIVETVAKREGFTDEQQLVIHDGGPKTEIEYRLSWARTLLKGMGLLTNSTRGVWALTDQGDGDPDTGEADESTWKEQLLHQLMAMQPDAFERLAKRLLREADFDSVTVTGKSGDGGIDGFGVYRIGLVSFPVFFQCKRYRGTVGSAAVRDFRGAMSGRGDKGLLITTGSFTTDAKKEANRDGAQAIDLIDGDRLCELLKRYELGVRT
ncbi:MAG: Mrr restriction system protein [Umezawaea sp.]